MADWRKIEAELIHVLGEMSGVAITKESGDAYAVVLSIEDCARPVHCQAVIAGDQLICKWCDDEVMTTQVSTIRITDLAKRLADAS